MPPLPATVPTVGLVLVTSAFLVKHLVCDFLLQTAWMAFGKERERDWVGPLAAHVGLHALGTGLVSLVFAPGLVWLAAVDFLVHAGLDRAKGSIGRRLGATPRGSVFWWLLGIDQALHALTHFAFTVAILAAAAA